MREFEKKIQCFCQQKFMEMAIILHTLFIGDDARFMNLRNVIFRHEKHYIFTINYRV